MEALSAASHLSKHPIKQEPTQSQAQPQTTNALANNANIDYVVISDDSCSDQDDDDPTAPATRAAPTPRTHTFPNELPDIKWPAAMLGRKRTGLNGKAYKKARLWKKEVAAFIAWCQSPVQMDRSTDAVQSSTVHKYEQVRRR